MFGIGIPEMLLILAIALIVIGPQKLPDLAKSLGRAMREFKKASTELKDSLQLDDDIDDVRRSFSDFKSDLKDSIDGTPETPRAEKTSAETGQDRQDPDVEQKIDDMERDYEKWKGDAQPGAASDEAQTAARRKDPDPPDDRSEI